jgi:hypothetical protein
MMKKSLLTLLLCLFAAMPLSHAEEKPNVIYWNTAEGETLRSRISSEADYWQLVPNFAVQNTQTYCAVASAITVLNSLPIKKPVEPVYAPYQYFTQTNFFSPAVSKIINAQTVLAQGMTRDEMATALQEQGVKAESFAGDSFDNDSLRELLQKALGNDGKFVLVNYARATFGQVGGGHWSVLAAFDEDSDSVLILDVAKYKYPPVWVDVDLLRQAIATIDSTSQKSRGLVLVSQ